MPHLMQIRRHVDPEDETAGAASGVRSRPPRRKPQPLANGMPPHTSVGRSRSGSDIIQALDHAARCMPRRREAAIPIESGAQIRASSARRAWSSSGKSPAEVPVSTVPGSLRRTVRHGDGGPLVAGGTVCTGPQPSATGTRDPRRSAAGHQLGDRVRQPALPRRSGPVPGGPTTGSGAGVPRVPGHEVDMGAGLPGVEGNRADAADDAAPTRSSSCAARVRLRAMGVASCVGRW